MQRLLGSHKRIALQLSLLVGIGLAFALGLDDRPALAGGDPECPIEGECTFKKPNILFVVDYSTAMNTIWSDDQTRWDVVVELLTNLSVPGGFLSQNTHLGLLRYGHDPDPDTPGTTIPGDTSGLVDGLALDVPWYDDRNLPWYECQGAAIGEALAGAGPPLGGAAQGIGSWTKRGLDQTIQLITQAEADHPEDQGEREYLTIVLTQGIWTSADGSQQLSPPEAHPAVPAVELFANLDHLVYVVGLPATPEAQAEADLLAAAGGTAMAFTDDSLEGLEEQVTGALIDAVWIAIGEPDIPECIPAMPRVMILLDASSSMLNVADGSMAGGMGETGWDQARAALADPGQLFDIEVQEFGVHVEDVTMVGLAVFGHDEPAPGEQAVLVDYAPCMQDDVAWALDPQTSCEQPGCDDPWGGPPIEWTFKQGSEGPDSVLDQTRSHMPRCEGEGFCAGSGTHTHLGLQLVKEHQLAYFDAALQPNAPFPASANTPFINILITDGPYTGWSTDAQVQAELEQMHALGIVTHVIGFGEHVDTPEAIAQLQSMADWGSGGALDYHDANTQAELEQALATIVATLSFELDPCCPLYDCPWGGEGPIEPDPVPSDEDETETNTSTDSTDSSDEDSTDSSDEDSTESTDSTDSTDDTSTGGESSTAGNDEIGEADTDGTSAGADDLVEGEGCNCQARANDDRGLLASLLGLGLLAWARRRRQVGRIASS